MAFYLSGRGMSIRRLLMFVLVLVSGVSPHSFKVSSCIHVSEGYDESAVSCNEVGRPYTGCTMLLFKSKDGSTHELSKGCQNMTEVALECVQKEALKVGARLRGNCISGPYTEDLERGWVSCLEKHLPGGRAREGTRKNETFSLCTCNHADLCNRNCRCDSSYGPYGAQPCETILPPNYRCHCGGVNPIQEIFHGVTDCDGGQQHCLLETQNRKEVCYPMAQQNTNLFKDCVYGDEMPLLECMHGKMEAAEGPGKCVTGTFGRKDAMATCAICLNLVRKGEQLRAREDGRDNARIKACYCTGELCNENGFSVDSDSFDHGGGYVGKKAKLALVVVALMLLECVRKWNDDD